MLTKSDVPEDIKMGIEIDFGIKAVKHNNDILLGLEQQ